MKTYAHNKLHNEHQIWHGKFKKGKTTENVSSQYITPVKVILTKGGSLPEWSLYEGSLPRKGSLSKK